jgi:tetratricopeptide (TPR) repeat protein
MKSRFLGLFVMLFAAAVSIATVVPASASASTPMLAAAPPPFVAAPAAKTPNEYIAEAQALAQGGKLAEAITLLQEAAAAHPRSPEVFAYLGSYVGQTAGQQGANYTEAMRIMTESYGYLDKAVELGPENPLGYFYRGIMSVNVPVFLGKLPAGIADMKKVVEIHGKAPAAVAPEMLVTAHLMLGRGYEAGGNPTDARASYEQVVKLAPGTETAKAAEARLAALGPAVRKVWPPFLAPRPDDPADIASLKKRIEAEPMNAAPYLDLAKAYIAASRLEDARGTLHAHNEVDPKNPEAYALIFQTVGALAAVGYDPKIAEDTRYRTNLAFEAMSAADKLVELMPNSVTARLNRGVTGVSMPFFVGKFDQGVSDLEYVLKNTKSPADSATAMYWLGAARMRQSMRFWLDVATKFPASGEARLSLDAMKPVENRLDLTTLARPAVVIDFVLGFRDELAPQTAVWIEDAAGKHVKTVMVTGFAGNVKGKQVTLPVWAAVSNFEGADAVTGASIDVGHFMYAWDCTDAAGKPVKPGTYTVKVEVAHWPSLRYQLAETKIAVGKKEATSRVEEGDYIPSLVVTYYAK